jgi:hypothetical protein
MTALYICYFSTVVRIRRVKSINDFLFVKKAACSTRKKVEAAYIEHTSQSSRQVTTKNAAPRRIVCLFSALSL